MAIAFAKAIDVFLRDETGLTLNLSGFTYDKCFNFICVITAIIRFYHGNIKYLAREYEDSNESDVEKNLNTRLAVDFFFFFLQGFIFCALALYQNKTFEFYMGFTILFFIDSTWFFIVINFTRNSKKYLKFREEEMHIKALSNWMVANLITGSIILIIILKNLNGERDSLDYLVPTFFIIIMINTVLDYILNINLYFPRTKTKKHISAFVSAKFTTAIKDGLFNAKLKETIETIIDTIKSTGITLFSSHENEKFGKDIKEPEDFITRDISNINESDIFIALLDEEKLGGVYIELGWATSIGKDIILIIPASFNLNKIPIIKGIIKITKCEILVYSDNNDLKTKLLSVLSSYI